MFSKYTDKSHGGTDDPEDLPATTRLIFSVIHIIVLLLYGIVFVYLVSTTKRKNCLGFIFV